MKYLKKKLDMCQGDIDAPPHILMNKVLTLKGMVYNQVS